MTAALVLLLLAAPAPPEIPVRTGEPIALDGRVEEAEWAEAFSVTRDRPGGGTVRFLLKRTGPWLSIGIAAEGAYRGEVLRLYATDASGAWITSLVLGLGQPTLPPAVWRRGPVSYYLDPEMGPGNSPRACLVRVHVGAADRWSAEVLVRLGALGIGRGDLRDLRGLIALDAFDPERREVLVLPGGAKDPLDASQYARLVSPDGWGASETWPPVTAAQTREFDDAELLYRLYLEEDKISQREMPDELVIASAVRPRSLNRINTLRKEIEAARDRNPTLPAWTYYLGRLLHEANLYGEARATIESIPPPLRTLDAFARLAAEHFLDTEDFDMALGICERVPYMFNQTGILKQTVQAKRLQEAERAAVERDAAKEEKNPRVAFETTKGRMVVELFEDDAPGVVRNFMDLVLRRRFYDGLRFHSVEGGHLAAIGDPRTRLGATAGTPGQPGFRLKQDPSTRALLRGYLAAVPLANNTVHGSEFIIAFAPMIAEMRTACVFGRIVEGLDVALKLEQDDLLEKVEVLSRRNHAYDASAARLDR